MANIASYLEEALLNHVMRNVEYSRPATVYLGLVSSAASGADLEAGTLTNEITAYTGNRKAITFGAPSQVGGKATIANTNEMEFEDMPAATVEYAIVCDSATVGNILYWMPLVDGGGTPITKATNAGDTFRVPVGDCVLDLD